MLMDNKGKARATMLKARVTQFAGDEILHEGSRCLPIKGKASLLRI